MTRAEELVLKMLDGSLSREEDAELARLTNDPASAAEISALLEVEAELLGQRRVDLSGPVMARIEQEQGERIQRAVMRKISQRRSAASGVVGLPARRSRFIYWINAGVAAAALIAIAIWFAWNPPQKASDPMPGIVKQIPPAPPAPPPAPPKESPKEPPAAQNEIIVFSQSFDEGLPPDWICGKLETANLPPGVKGAVRQLKQPISNRYGIHSPDIKSGTYEVKGDDVVHFTFRSDVSAKVKLQVWLKQLDGPRFGSCDYSYSSEAGKWQTVDLPFSAFSSAQVFKEGYKIGLVRYALGTPDIGLVLTRFWITRKKQN